MNFEDQPQAGPALGSRVDQLSTRAPSAPTMINGILDHNGNLLMGMDQVCSRLHSLLEKLTGPQPRNEAPTHAKTEGPAGHFHTLEAQQSIMDDRLREMIQTLEQIEQLM